MEIEENNNFEIRQTEGLVLASPFTNCVVLVKLFKLSESQTLPCEITEISLREAHTT